MAQPTPEQAKEILDTLRAELATLPTRALRIKRIQELMKGLDIKVDQGDADLVLNRFIQGGRITPVDVSGPAPGPGPTPGPFGQGGGPFDPGQEGASQLPIPTAALVPSEDVRDTGQRRALFENQPGREFFERGLGGAFGRPSSEFTPAARTAALGQFGQFQTERPITSFFDPGTDRGEQFQSFLGTPRSTREGLNQQINNILQGQASGDPLLQARFRSDFGTPTQIASLARQPLLAGLTSRNRAGVDRVLEQQAASRFASQPQEFTSPEALIRLLQDFESRGFIQFSPETRRALAPTPGGVRAQ